MCTFGILLGPTADPQKSLGEFCGNGTDVEVKTEGPVAFVVFHSDYLLTRQGFKLYIDAKHKGRMDSNEQLCRLQFRILINFLRTSILVVISIRKTEVLCKKAIIVLSVRYNSLSLSDVLDYSGYLEQGVDISCRNCSYIPVPLLHVLILVITVLSKLQVMYIFCNSCCVIMCMFIRKPCWQ